MQIMQTLENHYRDLCDIEFTIERGKLWMLQTRVGKRTAAAAFRIAMQLVDQGLIDEDEAVRRVSGADELEVDTKAKKFTAPGGITVSEGDMISIDGTSGVVYAGEVPVVASEVVRYFEGELHPHSDEADDLIRAVHSIMHHADQARRLGVYANADTGPDCARARRFGAGGVGLVRTEHMFLGERRQLVEDLILADTDDGRQHALDALEPLQKGDFAEILDAMDGLPVTIRLIDPPLHEFLPDLTDLSVKIALDGDNASDKDKALLAAVRRLHEQNPMLGLRGVRLGLVIPGLFDMQVRAIAHAAAELKQAGKDPRPEVMIPLTATVQEMEISREHAEKVLAAVAEETGTGVHTMIGTMIEVPRAALNAGPIAASAEFFSFGTNDLTQMTWGFSRDDVEGAFFSRYIELGIFGVSPFETIDRDGVGRLVDIAVREGKQARPDIELGVCGEHGGDPDSVHFFHEVGLDYVSCSPFRVPIARLEAGRAALAAEGSASR